MRSKNRNPLNVALYGMDRRSYKTMVMYLQGPCKGKAVVVDALDSEVDIIDADSTHAKDILDNVRSKKPNNPIILLSLERVIIAGTFYVKKPVEAVHLINALEEAGAVLQGEESKKQKTTVVGASEQRSKTTGNQVTPIESVNSVVEKKQGGSKHVDDDEIKKISKHRTAKDLTERSFSAYIGHVDGVDFTDREQVLAASYHPKSFFLGYVQSAIKVARAKARILQLNSGWKPLIIFPQSHEVWLDADDKQLRIFAGLVIKTNAAKSMSLAPIGKEATQVSENMENFYDMETFMWKLAVWTSKGRYPDSLDINRPVYLKRWPNFTRLIITPHALRIAALLINEPRTLINIAEVLNIKPQYVFVFISAAHALDLVGQVKREADEIVAPLEMKPSKYKGLFRRILGKLRG